MGRKRLPELPETGRHYVEHTARARLASPGIERFAPRRGGGWRRVAIAIAVAAALVAGMLWLAR